MKFVIETLGCKVNQYESQLMLEKLERSGFKHSQNIEEADILIINSCTVTATSDQKMRKMIHRAKRENSNIIVVLTGCMPQAFPEKAANIDGADIILGNANRDEIIDSIEEFKFNNRKIIRITEHQNGKPFESMQQINKFSDRTRAFIKIEDGCNRFCSYCIIPYARGRVRSKLLKDIENEVTILAKNGYKEIVLTGINLCAYGSDIDTDLYEAVKTVCNVPEVQRVRLGSLEPYYLTESVISKISKLEKFCPQFHISLQSGCDDTLIRMNRHYTAREYMKIVESIRKHFENPSITTDVMVGFAGESEEDFIESMNFIKWVGFAKIHVFPYSRRPKTRAYDFTDQIEKKVKLERAKKMGILAKDLRLEFLKSQIGKNVSILFERKNSDGFFEGYTQNYTPVKMYSDRDLSGEIINIVLDGEVVQLDEVRF